MFGMVFVKVGGVARMGFVQLLETIFRNLIFEGFFLFFWESKSFRGIMGRIIASFKKYCDEEVFFDF